jgi:hypothetical protein
LRDGGLLTVGSSKGDCRLEAEETVRSAEEKKQIVEETMVGRLSLARAVWNMMLAEGEGFERPVPFWV